MLQPRPVLERPKIVAEGGNATGLNAGENGWWRCSGATCFPLGRCRRGWWGCGSRRGGGASEGMGDEAARRGHVQEAAAVSEGLAWSACGGSAGSGDQGRAEGGWTPEPSGAMSRSSVGGGGGGVVGGRERERGSDRVGVAVDAVGNAVLYLRAELRRVRPGTGALPSAEAAHAGRASRSPCMSGCFQSRMFRDVVWPSPSPG